MKLILTQEVAGLGEPGDVIEVKDGYGRNYLLPRGFAMKWTRGAERQIELIKKARSAREIASLDHAREVADRLGALKVTLATRAGANGRLFGSVTAGDIAVAVKRAGGPDIDRRRIEMSNPIKTLGSHNVSVRLHPEVNANISLDIVAS
ncbi:MAG TPA: 50S ribosomal protein L9 [Streptosporangiaceae bacterium]|nr:50S ribosomal protein L9 [Streptosporangiaceae bacterium]